MFTGIVEHVGSIVARAARGPGARLVVATRFRDLVMGESIAVAGVCLTVDGVRAHGGAQAFEADASAETLARSTLASAVPGTKVNIERALRADARLGGHFVGGHVDARARLSSMRPLGEATEMRFSLPAAIARYVAPKGSIAIDGVSLTVNQVRDGGAGEDGWFDVAIIPHTLRETTLIDLEVGHHVNLEVDVLARYVARRLEPPRHASDEAPEGDSLLRALRGAGFL